MGRNRCKDFMAILYENLFVGYESPKSLPKELHQKY
jgi:hypothetical protein